MRRHPNTSTSPVPVLTLLLLVLAGTACGGQEVADARTTPEEAPAGAASQEADRAASQEADEEEIRRLSDEYLEAYRARDASAVSQLFAEDAILVSEEGVQRGRDRIRQELERGFADRGDAYEIDWSPDEIDVAGSGDMAHELGTWEEVRDGERQRGSYLSVWEKVDGEWKLLRDASVTYAASAEQNAEMP